MCESGRTRGYGWKGWRPLPPMASVAPVGEWVDLSHPLGPDTPRVPFFPPPKFERVRCQPEHLLNVTEMSMVVHIGTHVDSPRHFYLDGPAFEDVPLDRLHGPGLVWPVQVGSRDLIEPAHLKPAEDRLAPGDILLINTGWHRCRGSEGYEDHPALSEAAARWIIEKGIKLVGVDNPTPDVAVIRRQADFDYPVHRILLANGVLVAEHLTNLAALSGARVEVVCNPLNIVGSDGAPARILGRAVRE